MWRRPPSKSSAGWTPRRDEEPGRKRHAAEQIIRKLREAESELGSVFAELSQPWGAQIVLQSAEDYLRSNEPVRFGDLDCAAASRGEIALGFRLSEGGLVLNPERDTDWVLAAGDEVVVLTSCAERDLAGLAAPNAASVTRSQGHGEQ